MRTEHRLAAIVFADILGYTSMMEADETRAFAALERFTGQMCQKVGEFGGQVIQFWGDGCLSIFDSSVDAVTCSMELQQSFLGERLPVRIGVSSGEIILTDSNAYGNAINVSARLESIGVAGSILLTQKVKEELENKPRFNTVALGEVLLKNVSEAVSIYALSDGILQVPDRKDLPHPVSKPRRRRHPLLAALGVIFGILRAVI